MTNDLDQRINNSLHTLVRAAPDLGPTPNRSGAEPQQAPQRFRIFAVAASLLAAVAALGYITTTDQDSPASVVIGPALLQPASDSGIQIGNREFLDDSRIEAGGAVVAPDSTVFGLIPISTQTIETFPPTYEERTIGGLQAWAAEDGSAPAQTRRGIEIGCGTLSVTTGQGPMWPPALEALANGLEADDTTVTVQLPDGWRSLGSATNANQYSNTLTVTVGGDEVRLRVRQAIGQPVGMWLSSTETNPVEIDDRDQPTWHVAGGTTPSLNTLVSVRNGTLLEISGRATVDVLLDVLDSLEPVPADEWLDSTDEVDDTPSMTIEGSETTACQLRSLAIIE